MLFTVFACSPYCENIFQAYVPWLKGWIFTHFIVMVRIFSTLFKAVYKESAAFSNVQVCESFILLYPLHNKC